MRACNAREYQLAPPLADLDRDAGDAEAARALAEQVRRWVRVLGIGILESGAAEIAGA